MSSKPTTVIFVDAENIFFNLNHLAQQNGFNYLNIHGLIHFLEEKFGKFRMYVYGHFTKGNGFTRGLPPFIKKELDRHPTIYVFETIIDDSCRMPAGHTDQAIINAMNVKDIGLSANDNLYKHVVIMSGDGDFFDSAIKARNLGMKVTIVAVSEDSLNEIYHRSGFEVFLLDKIYTQFHENRNNDLDETLLR